LIILLWEALVESVSLLFIRLKSLFARFAKFSSESIAVPQPIPPKKQANKTNPMLKKERIEWEKAKVILLAYV
jgi:hypothetical protein